MKRPTIALLSILFLLALGLAASSPRSTQAGSLGELAFAIQVESTDSGDPIVCPMVCCPFPTELAAKDEVRAVEPAIELNAAETNDTADQLAEEEQSYDDEYAYDDEYYHDDEYYYEDYGSEYGDEVADVDATTSKAEMELNAPETSEDEHLSDGCWKDYAEHYADDYDYTEFGDDYEADETPAAEVVSDCNDGCYGPVAFPLVESAAGVRCEISDADLFIDADSQANGATAVVDPYDCYGRQVGDEYAHEAEPTVDEYDDSYYEDYYYGEQFDEEVSSDENVEETYEEDYERYYSEEYYEQLEDPAAEATEPAYEETYDEYQDYYDSEEYYDEYYQAPDETAAEATEPSYKEDYQDFYDEDYNEDDSDWIDDYTSEYDAIYDDAVYGDVVQPVENARNQAPSPPVVDEPCGRSGYLLGECIDERNSEIVDDLPWADEICDCEEITAADIAEIDIPVDGVTSEYGSDYAEEYYEAYFDWLEEQEAPAPAAEGDAVEAVEAAACQASAPAVVKTVRKTFDVQGFATYCGSRVAALTASLAGLGRAIRTAAVDLETHTR